MFRRLSNPGLSIDCQVSQMASENLEGWCYSKEASFVRRARKLFEKIRYATMAPRMFLLFAILVAVAADSFTQQIERHTRPTPASGSRPIQGRWTTLRRQNAQRLKSGSQPFIDDYDEYYVGNITIGKPGNFVIFINIINY